MSQADVWEVFEKRPKEWLTNYDIAKELNVQKNKISKHLEKLRRFGIIYRMIVREIPPYSKQQVEQYVRYYKLVPKGKYITYDFDIDELNNKGKTEFVY